MKELLGISINGLENVLMSIAGFFLVLYLITVAIEKKPNWFMSKNLRECLKMEEKFNKLVESRRDSVHHYYWAKSSEEKKKMNDMDKEITRVDGEISDLREKYKLKRASLPRIIQKFI